ncbi:MAG: T9SS type A sorting domain-containing protein [Bacteroidetes bacterium]|nr:T9SS type A sorting domain-containing protein [Bacteroidota bacterium]
MKTNLIYDENCFPYNCNPVPACPIPLCSNPADNILITSYHSVANYPVDEFQKELIQYGPICCHYTAPGYSHEMVFVAYGSNKSGDVVYSGTGYNDPPIVIDNTCSILGGIRYTLEDSNKPADNPFLTIEETDFSAHIGANYGECFFLYDDLNRPINPTGIICSDEDGDGYYWWGLHWKDDNGNIVQVSPQDCGCPPWVKAEDEDCNDDDVFSGPYNPITFECQQNPCSTLQDTINIGTNGSTIYWNTDRHINKNIYIGSSNKLVISANVYMSKDTRIIVCPGGELEITDQVINSTTVPGRITSGCHELWSGIELHGNPALSQTQQNQGKIKITNGIIENAWCGIKTFNPGWIPDNASGGKPVPEPGYPSGGIIEADHATFKNNYIGVEFYPYHNGTSANKSYFSNCIFITDAELLSGVKPQYLLKINGVRTVPITGCVFQNTIENTHVPVQYYDRGKGIYCNNSDLNLNNSGSVRTEFHNLQYGIYSMMNGLADAKVSIENAIFNGNKSGAYFSGYTEVNDFEIHNCTFTLDKNFGTAIDSLYGLYLNNCSGYKVHQDILHPQYGFHGTDPTTTTGWTNVNQFGIIINNSGTNNNFIYNNNFSNLTYALQGQNINKFTGALPENIYPNPVYITTGLCFVCNDFTNCKNDFVINQNQTTPNLGIKYYQRNIPNPPAPCQKPAGNTFSPDHGNQNPSEPNSWTRFDVNIDNYVGDIQYMYHKAGSLFERLEPIFITNTSKVYKQKDNSDYTKNYSCPDNFYPQGSFTELKALVNLADVKIDSISSLLSLLIDLGSSDSLNSIVNSSNSSQSYDLYQSLMMASPYISDTVMKSSIIKEDVLPNAMIRDVMVHNPHAAKNEDLLNTLDSRVNSVPDSMWAEILQGKDTIGSMERLESELSSWIHARTLYLNELIIRAKQDTLPGVMDSLVSFLQDDYFLSSNYDLVFLYLCDHKFSSAESLLENIPNKFDLSENEFITYQKFIILVPLLELLVNDSLGYNYPDSLTIISLQTLAEEDNDPPGAFARNTLISTGLLNYQEPIILESNLKSIKNPKQYGRKKQISPTFTAYPNPCNDFIIIEFQRGQSTESSELRLYNSRGICIANYTYERPINQLVVPFPNSPPGIYFVQLKVNGVNKGSRKILKHN